MPKPILFLGSSSAARSQAKAFASAFSDEAVEFLPWWEAFTPGRTLLSELDGIKDKVQGALLLFSPEAESTVRGSAVQTPNLNVLFEFGYFYGHFGPKRVAMLKYGNFYLPSDFGGYIHVHGSSFFKRGAVVQVGKRTTTEFNRWLLSFAQDQPSTNAQAPSIDRAERSTAARARMQAADRSLPTGPNSWMGR